MITPVRLTAVLTHPIQYYAPWFRHLHAHAPEIELTVVHATQPTPEQQGVGFDRPFEWDIPLTGGYRSVTVRRARPEDRIDSSSFTGLDVPEIGRAIANTSPDVVMITGWYSLTLVRALFACRRLGVPTLYRGDSHLLSGPRGWKRPLWTLKTHVLLRQFDGFLSPGVRVKEYLQWYGVPAHRIFQVPHAVDNEMFAAAAAPYHDPVVRAAARRRWGIDPDAFVTLFVGKLVKSKRPLNVVRAVARLPAGTTLIVVGSGPLEGEVRAEAARLGVALKMVGFLNQSELGEPYGLADCLALPSDFPETWGLVINEALATGLPCVVSEAVGCAPDLIREGETGYVYPLDDVDALTKTLALVRDRKAARYDWGPACRALANRYSYDAMTAGVVRACRSVIAHSISPEPNWRKASRRVVSCCGQMVIAGGLERMTFEVLHVLRKHGAATHAIVNGWENFRITPLADASGASWSAGPYWYPLVRRKLTPVTIGQMVIEVVSVSANLLAVARRTRATHIFLPDYQTVLRNAPALFWLRLRGVQTIARLGNAPAPGRFYRLLWRHVVDRFVDRFVSNSGFTRRELLAVGVSPAKVETIPNMPARRATPWCADGPRIPGRVIFVGQIIPEKGLDLLLDAVALLRARGIDTTLDVVGEIDGWEAPTYRGHRASLRARAAKDDLAGAVQFLGWREDVPVLMGRASVHCCPSRPEQREAFGNVVLEAKVSGVPSVVMPSGDLPELVSHKVDGWVCAHVDAETLAEGLAFFLTQPDELARAGKAARASAAEYSEERFAAAWNHVFQTNLKEKTHARQ
ncbi:MAG TPA: glycosyltransferase [Vicinamibacterales bacterium]|nr:glycosyltransferase [Vicinamibacterales bacterium]